MPLQRRLSVLIFSIVYLAPRDLHLFAPRYSRDVIFLIMMSRFASGRHVWTPAIHRATKRSLRSGPDAFTEQQFESSDSSINTMEKILTILRDAQSTTSETHLSEAPSMEKKGSFDEKRFHFRLGQDVIDYSILSVLNLEDHVLHNKVFGEVGPDITKVITQRAIANTADRLHSQEDHTIFAPLAMGYRFAEQPAQTISKLKGRISKFQTPKSDENVKHLIDSLPMVKFGEPFREKVLDPLALVKNTSMKKFPLNLFLLMIDDERVMETFISRSRASLTPRLALNIMSVQQLEGALAFKILVKKHLRDIDPLRVSDSPFEGFHRFPSSNDDTDIEIVKAIAASRSRLVNRLESYRDYTFGLMNIFPEEYSTNGAIVKWLASLFDRFFGSLYRSNAKYCDLWVKDLINFYLDNQANEELFERLFLECIRDFRKCIDKAKFDQHQFRWGRRRDKALRPGAENVRELISLSRRGLGVPF